MSSYSLPSVTQSLFNVVRHVTRACPCMTTSIIIKITRVISMWTPHWITVSCHGVEGPITTGYYCAIFPFCGGGKKKRLGYYRYPSNKACEKIYAHRIRRENKGTTKYPSNAVGRKYRKSNRYRILKMQNQYPHVIKSPQPEQSNAGGIIQYQMFIKIRITG